MSALFRIFLNICFLQASPSDLPYSRSLLRFTLFFHVLLSYLLLINQLEPELALLHIVVNTALYVVLIQALLHWRGAQARFNQTLTAIMGCSVLFNLIALPVYYTMPELTPQNSGALLPALLLLALLPWSLLVDGHILRRALNLPLHVGVLISVAYLYLAWGITDLLPTT